jgi:hypothetical protein
MQLETIKELIDERDSLDPSTEQYEELTDEIKLLQNDLVTIAILGEN